MQAFIGDQFEYSQDLHDSSVQCDMLVEEFKDCKGIELPTINEMFSGSHRFVKELQITILHPIST